MNKHDDSEEFFFWESVTYKNETDDFFLYPLYSKLYNGINTFIEADLPFLVFNLHFNFAFRCRREVHKVCGFFMT